MPVLTPDRIAAMERATLDAVPPAQREELHGWLVAVDDGVVFRARCATPLWHDTACAEAIDAVVARYQAAGQPPCLRVPDTERLHAVHAQLTQRGWAGASPTLVQVADASDVLSAVPWAPAVRTGASSDAAAAALRWDAQPDDAWCAVFLGDAVGPGDVAEGVSAAEAASRTAILRRARHACYASVVVDGQTVATGMGSFSEGWASVHGMRTRASYRGQGRATAILRRIAQEAVQRGLPQLFLQVEQSNTGAQALYRRLGFRDLWTYRYWMPSAPR